MIKPVEDMTEGEWRLQVEHWYSNLEREVERVEKKVDDAAAEDKRRSDRNRNIILAFAVPTALIVVSRFIMWALDTGILDMTP